MVRLPYSKKKRYLTGIDWIVQGLDYLNRRATGGGNMFQVVMELDGVVAEDELREALGRISEKFPVVNGRVRRDYNLAPYWEMPSRTAKTALPLIVQHLQDDQDVFPFLERAANMPFGNQREHLAFHLIGSGGRSYAAVTFDHCLFDAHGAEAFLRMLEEEWGKKGPCTRESVPSEPPHLSEWRRKFEAGRQVNRAFLRLTKGAGARVLPLVSSTSKQGFRFRVIPFNEQQSKKIMERADREAGYLMATPYTMAVTAQILHSIFTERGVCSGDYIVPLTMDARQRGGVAGDVFFNHVSFFLFRIDGREVEDFSMLLKSIKKQMYEQVRAGLARHMVEASSLMRIVPLPILSYLIRVYLKGEAASFCFSFLGETGQMATSFMGKKVDRSYHMTRVPIPPGLGVFFQQSQGRLSAYLSYVESLLTEDEVNAIVEGLRLRLGG